MSNTTLSVPADLKQKINKQNEKAKLFDELEELTKNSTLTDEDCLRLGNELNERVWKKHKAEGW